MFEQWSLTDVLAGTAGIVAVAYVGFELSRRQRKLRNLFNVLDGADATLTPGAERPGRFGGVAAVLRRCRGLTTISCRATRHRPGRSVA